MMQTVFDFILPIVSAVLTAFLGFLGVLAERLYQKHVTDETKERVVNICVNATEQLYSTLGGAEKLERATQSAATMLAERGIETTAGELRLLIESAVSRYNRAFEKKA